MSTSSRSPKPFLPALEGMRAVAALGIIVAHVAFQTGNDTGPLVNRMMARLDFFVPVFFALSGFLLWRRHAAETGWASYYVKRLARIMPAYWVTVVVVLLLFPVASEGGGPGAVATVANLLLMQNYVPDGLVGGLTHLWSLCVEMFFYLLMPLLALAVGRRRRRVRVVAILGVGALSYLWPFVAWHDAEVNAHIMPWAFLSWFAAGLLAAELEGWLADLGARGRDDTVRQVRRWAGRRWIWILLAALAVVVAAVDGPEGLVTAGDGEFARRNLYGLVFAASLIVPWAVEPRSRVLDSAVMQALGRWSYSIFLWHMAMLSLVFPLLGVGLFQGQTVLVLVATVALTVPVAALSYALVEDPARRAVNRWWRGRSLDGSVR
ncbi:acyltransferase [Corynebacterium sp.]|uniref:acyltransferase family protein n=1 Tax=Corynebacterium sp. TaxID=1720 RepID=UPI0025BE391F|nr:acyltransferase [Corynebacterium sp.]